MQARGKRYGVPASLLPNKFRTIKFANWPNSAGMGPGVYKTQSKHTQNKSHYPTGTIRKESLFLHFEQMSRKKGEKKEGGVFDW